MSFLVGTFRREYAIYDGGANPLSDVSVVEEYTKEHLVLARKDDNYQVIDLVRKQYFDPNRNEWVNLKK